MVYYIDTNVNVIRFGFEVMLKLSLSSSGARDESRISDWL